ncbi:MMPL family transporter [Dactylosporangium sp. NPDC049742]|uniref:MMPL family transporter n=1 Tax=Dactylosporangium sp. NPDC049742 TaxID=3154737 RepID=UPI003448DC9F
MIAGRNLAAVLGGWSVRHRVAAIGGWLLVVVVTTLLGSAAGQRQMTVDEYAAGESAQAIRILQQAGISQPAGEMIMVRSDALTADDAAFRDAVGALTAAVQATGQVTELVDPYVSGLVSADRHSVLVRFAMAGPSDTAWERVQPVLDAVAAVRAAHPDMTVGQFGAASANKWFNDTVLRDFHRAEWTAIPLALGILVVAFGALLAAVLPVGLAMTAFFAANGLLAVISHRMHVDSTASSVMLLVGLAVGVDYCLFYLRREREEREAGRDPQAALQVAAATSGRAVLVSGATVVVAMSGMFLSGMLLFNGFAVATISVVLIAMLGSVTVLPALLSILGAKVDLGRIPGLGRRGDDRRRARGSRIWGAVLARPWVSAVAATLFLLVLAAPVVGMRTEKLTFDKQLPADTPIVRTYHDIARTFPGGPAPARVVVQAGSLETPQVRQAMADFTAAALATGLVREPVRVVATSPSGVAEIEVPLAGDGSDDVSVRALHALREDVVPSTLTKVPGVRVYVTGDLAFSSDFNDQLGRSIVPVLAFVMGIAFMVMLFAFRSLTIAVVSIVLNLISVGAAFGVMVAVFQHGWGAGLVGTVGVGAIESWIPLFAFVILFGLSMDYHVFVVSRIREAHDAGMPIRAAVLDGVRSTAGVVTSAAIIMVGVFAVLGSLSMQDFKQLGVGLAVAILLDATVVRVVLLPSVLALLGDRTWYLPRWIDRLAGRRRHRDAPATEPASSETRDEDLAAVPDRSSAAEA